MHQMTPTPDRSICYKVQQQTASFCVTSTRPPCLGSRYTSPVLGGSGPISLPTSCHIGQTDGQATGLPLQEIHSDYSRVAQVLGSSGHVKLDPSMPAQSTDTVFLPDALQESVKPKSACLAPRASAIKEQGFSEVVAVRIVTPQRGSTSSVYAAKWIIFTK